MKIVCSKINSFVSAFLSSKNQNLISASTKLDNIYCWILKISILLLRGAERFGGDERIISQFPPISCVRVEFHNSRRKWCECANFPRGMHGSGPHPAHASARLSSLNIFHRVLWLEAIGAVDRNRCATAAAAVNRSALMFNINSDRRCVCISGRAFNRGPNKWQTVRFMHWERAGGATTTSLQISISRLRPSVKNGGRERGFYRNCHRHCAASVLMRWLIASASLQHLFLVVAIFPLQCAFRAKRVVASFLLLNPPVYKRSGNI